MKAFLGFGRESNPEGKPSTITIRIPFVQFGQALCESCGVVLDESGMDVLSCSLEDGFADAHICHTCLAVLAR